MFQVVPRILWFTLILVISLPAGGAPDEGDPGVHRFSLEIRDRHVQIEGNVIRVNRGDRVELAWTADERVTLHLHGYDLEFEVVPGEPAVREFEAHATGRFPVTSHGFGDEHGGHHTLLYLEVYPE